MHGIFFDIGLGAGLAACCGLRPFLPVLLAGALGSAGALGVEFGEGKFSFLQSGWWLLAVAIALVLSYALQLLGPRFARWVPAGASARVDPLTASVAGLGYGCGALLFAGTLAAHGEAWWPGVIGGLLAAALADRVSGPLIGGARARLTDRAAREALTVYLDAAALALAVLVSLLHPLGYVLIGLFGWLLLRARARSGEKYAGLRILRR